MSREVIRRYVENQQRTEARRWWRMLNQYWVCRSCVPYVCPTFVNIGLLFVFPAAQWRPMYPSLFAGSVVVVPRLGAHSSCSARLVCVVDHRGSTSDGCVCADRLKSIYPSSLQRLIESGLYMLIENLSNSLSINEELDGLLENWLANIVATKEVRLRRQILLQLCERWISQPIFGIIQHRTVFV